jgi:hypothetical protein
LIAISPATVLRNLSCIGIRISAGGPKDAIQQAVTRAEKETAEDLGVDPKDLDKALQETMKEL